MSVTKEQLDEYIKAYSEGHPLVSDEAYDAMLEEYLKEHPESKRPFTRQKQSSNVNDIVGTLPKVYGVKEPMRPGQKVYMDWVKKLKPDDKIVIQPKFDGCSVAADLTGKEEKLFTRGDFDNGESVDVSDILETYFFNHHCRVTADDVEVRLSAIKYEAICSLENYEKCFKDKYSRPRDVVAAGITSRTCLKHPGDSTNFADMIPLRWYWNDGSQTLYDNMEAVSQVLDADDFEGIQRFIDNLLKNEATVKFENIHDFEMEWYGTYQCDGVVVSRVKSIVNNWIEIDPEYEVAIKILDIKQETKLVDINWQFGNSGHITPVAIVEPIKFGNVVVRNVGLSTFERVINMNLRYGDTVQIMYNIVPYFVGSKGDGNLPIPIPDNCPICQFKLDKSSLKQVKCTNPNCPGRMLGNVIRYCQSMRMFGVSEGIITKLNELGYINDIMDLYTVDLMKASTESGFGWKSIQNITNSIQMASTNVPVHRWLGALPCDNVSDRKWKMLLESIYGKNNPEMNENIMYLCSLDKPDKFLKKMIYNAYGIGPMTIDAIKRGITENWKNIKTIIKYITFAPIEYEEIEIKHGVVCMSGTRDAHTQNVLKNLGYEITDSFTRDVTALVVPDLKYNSSKVEKAKKNGIPIYTLNDIDNGALS